MPKAIAAAAPAFTADQLALITEREEILKWLKPAQDREMEIRKQLAAALVPSPKEGTQRLVTEDGYEVILVHKINRGIDEAQIDAVMLELPEDSPFRVPGVLIRYKPELVSAGYKGLPADQLKIVQQAITEKDGSPELTIIKKPAEEAPAERTIGFNEIIIPATLPEGAHDMVDRSAGKARDGTIGNAINRAHKKDKAKGGAKKKK